MTWEWAGYVEDTTDTFWGQGTPRNPGLNTLGQLHNELADNCILNVLIAGSSHVREMDEYLQPILSDATKKQVRVASICVPGGTVLHVQDKLADTDLSTYSAIITVAGGCSLYTKDNIRDASPKQVAGQLCALRCVLEQRLPGRPILISSVMYKTYPTEMVNRFHLTPNVVQTYNNTAHMLIAMCRA